MTLAFSTQINGKPSHFVEKITASLWQKIGNELDSYTLFSSAALGYKHKKDFIYAVLGSKDKKHTIRIDKNAKWRRGMNVHMVINNRTKKRYQFAPVIKCTGVQRVQIYNLFGGREIIIGSHVLLAKEIRTLAMNDGFDSTEEFWEYFGEVNLDRVLIHWTDLRY